MTISSVVAWMEAAINNDGCLYQDEVVNFLITTKREEFLRENADGNQVLTVSLLNAFRKSNQDSVVWVKPQKYWRTRVPEDDGGREARG